MNIEEINDMITEAINRATQKVTAKQNQKEEILTDKIKEMLREGQKEIVGTRRMENRGVHGIQQADKKINKGKY